jgi:molybdopterin-guanine dinucleotide biosynthesis protein A
MGRDKATLVYRDKPQVEVVRELLSGVCARVFTSCRPDQENLPEPVLRDRYDNIGPLAGVLTAMDAHPDCAWLVAACDLPFLDRATLEFLVAHRDPGAPATAFRGRLDRKPEPLCAIYEPTFRGALHQYVREGVTCPRKILMRSAALLLDLPQPFALENANRPEDADRARAAFPTGAPLDLGPPAEKRECDTCPPREREVQLRLYAILRERLGQSDLTVQTRAQTAAEIWGDLQRRFGIEWPLDRFRVAINDRFESWQSPVRGGDVIHIIPPVAGG